MSVKPEDLDVDFVLPNFNLCMYICFGNKADEETES